MDFTSIRPYHDDEFETVIEKLSQEADFNRLIEFLFPGTKSQDFIKYILSLGNLRSFQHKIISPYIGQIAQKSTTGLTISGLENISNQDQYLFISNHRDIVLDPGFLNFLLIENGFETTEIAIGDNLLIFPWIEHLVRLNKSFIVQRNLPVRQQLEAAKTLSAYVRHALTVKHHSVWIAQREGRAKDSDDRTADGLLKMLSFSGDDELVNKLKTLKITPISISYEFDPCDYLKAREFLLKSKNPEFKKSQEDDLLNMSTGMKGFKGEVHFHVCKTISDELDNLDLNLKNGFGQKIASLIDNEIHSGYKTYPHNFIALDKLNGDRSLSENYNSDDEENFETYIKSQLDKIPESKNNSEYLRNQLYKMYANPLKNKICAEK